MSIPREPKPAKLVVGLFMRTTNLEEYLALDLSSRFGSIDIVSAWLPFDYTSYYEPEMGAPLYRRVFAFDKFIQQRDLAKIKHTTNQIEQKYSRRAVPPAPSPHLPCPQ